MSIAPATFLAPPHYITSLRELREQRLDERGMYTVIIKYDVWDWRRRLHQAVDGGYPNPPYDMWGGLDE